MKRKKLRKKLAKKVNKIQEELDTINDTIHEDQEIAYELYEKLRDIKNEGDEFFENIQWSEIHWDDHDQHIRVLQYKKHWLTRERQEHVIHELYYGDDEKYRKVLKKMAKKIVKYMLENPCPVEDPKEEQCQIVLSNVSG